MEHLLLMLPQERKMTRRVKTRKEKMEIRKQRNNKKNNKKLPNKLNGLPSLIKLIEIEVVHLMNVNSVIIGSIPETKELV